MRSKRRTHAAIAAVVIGTIILALSTSVGQNRRNYDVEAQVYTTPEYRTDASRAIDAYERVMERYMDATEQGFAGIGADLGAVAARLEAVDARLAKLDERLERIERHLGILPPPPPMPDPNAPLPPAPAPLSSPAPRRYGGQ
ncbi:MAG: hypothetical protein RBS72_18540 [Sedimentisphaerales bacterium]|nr:hypothetical protein [Sedimentisphaerales bacterium]HNY78411.1 hypothetical protein [Sedimentisphaerales bacterium]HOC63612.1 hypothetical protein [Sedimentisphaerales bacterium]HOH64450.1 hypothetical protein [Sedimentisphaerales bacterium]HPY51506.1 hypothetical protein [Sedimentisphaerales bacterium]